MSLVTMMPAGAEYKDGTTFEIIDHKINMELRAVKITG